MSYSNTLMHFLERWKPYLTVNDFNFISQFVENVRIGAPNYPRLLILSGPGRTGKTMLQEDIQLYLGTSMCQTSGNVDEMLNRRGGVKPMVFLHGIDSCDCINTLCNILRYGQSIIAETNRYERIHQDIVQMAEVIQMTHVFL